MTASFANRIHTFAGFMLCVCVLTSAGYADDATKKAHDQLQGTWVVDRTESAGTNYPGDAAKPSKITIKGYTLIPSRDPKRVATFKLDASKMPATIDLTDDMKMTTLGIYKIDGDSLTICTSSNDKVRPATFTTGEDRDDIMLFLKREKR